MKAVIQRVLDANLKVDGQIVSQINKGYVIFLGVMQGDTKEQADYMIKKMELFGGDSKGLYSLDAEYAARIYSAPSLILD